MTENAKNMVKACQILRKQHLPCVAHTINLVVQDCLSNDKIKTLLAKCKSIVTFFKSSTIAYAKLKEAQCSDRPLSLKQECQTRWNSAFVMIQRILQTRDAISKVLLNTSKALLPLSADEVYVLEDLMQILSPFEQATLHTSSSSLVTVSMVIPIVCGLLHNLENLRAKLVTDLGIQACTILIKSTKERLVPYETSLNTRIATLLDPRFKKDGFLSEFNVTEAEKILENKLFEINSLSEPHPSSSSCSAPISTTTLQQPLFEFLKKKKSDRIHNNEADIILGLRPYFDSENSDSKTSPLDYWKVT